MPGSITFFHQGQPVRRRLAAASFRSPGNAVVPAITRPRFVRQSTRLALTDIFTVDHNMFGIARRTIGDTKVVITIVGGKIVYETGNP